MVITIKHGVTHTHRGMYVKSETQLYPHIFHENIVYLREDYIQIILEAKYFKLPTNSFNNKNYT